MFDARKFSLHPFRFEELSPTEFENSIAFLYQLQGYQTTVCGGAGDQGVDIEARNDHEFMVIQCKRYTKTNTVGSQAVQILFAAINANQANKGILVTTNTFTKHAKQYAHQKPIELIDGIRLDHLAKRYHIGPYFVLSDELQARAKFFNTLCQEIGKHAVRREEDFIDTLKLTFQNIVFEELLWMRHFAQKHQERLNIEIHTSNFSGGLLDFTAKSTVTVHILSLEDSTLKAVIELINYVKTHN